MVQSYTAEVGRVNQREVNMLFFLIFKDIDGEEAIDMYYLILWGVFFP